MEFYQNFALLCIDMKFYGFLFVHIFSSNTDDLRLLLFWSNVGLKYFLSFTFFFVNNIT